MEGVGLLFVLLIIGMPLLILAILAGYYFDRRNSGNDGNEQELKYAEAMPLASRETLRLFLLHPDDFFRRLSDCRPGLYRSFILIVMGGLIFDAGYLFILEPVMLRGGIINILVMVLGTLPLLVFIAVSGWIVLAVLLHGISGIIGGTGPFATTLQNAGYGMAFYQGMTGLILMICAVMMSIIRYVPGYRSLGYPPYQEPVIIFISVVVICILIWASWYWSYGLVHARKIPFPRAAIMVYGIIIAYLAVTSLPALVTLIGNR